MPLCSAIWNFLRNIKTDTVVCCCCLVMEWVLPVMMNIGWYEWEKRQKFHWSANNDANKLNKDKKNSLTERIKSNWIGQKAANGDFYAKYQDFSSQRMSAHSFFCICKTCHKLSVTKERIIESVRNDLVKYVTETHAVDTETLLF